MGTEEKNLVVHRLLYKDYVPDGVEVPDYSRDLNLKDTLMEWVFSGDQFLRWGELSNRIHDRCRYLLGIEETEEDHSLYIAQVLLKLTASDLCYALLLVYGPLNDILVPRYT